MVGVPREGEDEEAINVDSSSKLGSTRSSFSAGVWEQIVSFTFSDKQDNTVSQLDKENESKVRLSICLLI